MRILVMSLLLLLQAATADAFIIESRNDTLLSDRDDKAAETWPNYKDAGGWFGLRVGLAANGNPFADQLMAGLLYEHRTKGLVSFVFEGNLYRQREGPHTNNISLLGASLRIRVYVLKNSFLYIQGGGGLSSGVIVARLQYCAGIEVLPRENITVGLAINGVQLIGSPYWVAGISFRVP